MPCSSALPSFAARLRDAGAVIVHEHLLDRGDHLSVALDQDCSERIITFLIEKLRVPTGLVSERSGEQKELTQI